MQIGPYNKCIGFGDLKGVRCVDKFSKDKQKHVAAIGAMLDNPAFDEFGKNYDYVAEFSFYNFKNPVYKLSLAPVHGKFEEVKREPNKPEDVPFRLNIIYSASQNSENAAYNNFIHNIKTVNLDDIIAVINRKPIIDIYSSKNQQEQPDMSNIPSVAERTLKTLSDRGIPFLEDE